MSTIKVDATKIVRKIKPMHGGRHLRHVLTKKMPIGILEQGSRSELFSCLFNGIILKNIGRCDIMKPLNCGAY